MQKARRQVICTPNKGGGKDEEEKEEEERSVDWFFLLDMSVRVQVEKSQQ